MTQPGKTIFAGIGIFMLGLSFGVAPAANAADFSGKTVRIIVPSKEGSGTNRYARLLQKFMEKYLPGNPTVLVVNMPGGAFIKGSNWFQREAKPDGLTLITGSSSMLNSYVFGGKKIQYKLLTWRPIILSPLGTQFFTQRKNGVYGEDIGKDIKVLQKGSWSSGGKNPTSGELRNFIAYDLLGIKNITPVFGLSTGNRRKAVLRGELQLSHDNTVAFIGKSQKYVEKGLLSHYMTLGYIKPDGSIGPDPAFPNKPTIFDAYKAVYGKAPSGPQWKALWHLMNIAVMSAKSLWLPAGTSDDILNAYIDAMKKVLKDPEFIKVGGKAFDSYPQSFGGEAAKIVKNAVTIDKETYAWIRKWIKKRFDHNI
jgi:tripartite-type tricarboxylate transporter receptor subunit TctC